MNKSLKKLLDISSASSSSICKDLDLSSFEISRELFDQLVYIYQKKNGFYAFENALHFFSCSDSDDEISVEQWNDRSLWLNSYAPLNLKGFFFAEDIFGCQFCIKDSQIYSFDPEIGSFEYLAKDFEEWAGVILTNYRILTGYDIAHKWQMINGSLKKGCRLLPKLPFILGGEFLIENLYLSDSIKGMRSRAAIATQLIDIKDGEKIKIAVN